MGVDSAKLIVGIGNPGAQYTYTRHNVGFLVAQAFSEKYGLEFKRKTEVKGSLAKGLVEGISCGLLRPSTYVNLSGDSVARAKKVLNVSIDNILVVVDDVDLPFGITRLRQKAGSGGHNGIKSITSSLGSNAYYQLRVGVGRPEGLAGLSDYVLSDFSLEERGELDGVIDRAVTTILEWMSTRLVEE
ncbi:aminoacyl-tRNA hydrolase [Chlamydiifrater phoenicopteri]|uniref:aminoacyl-tRNA hydrolase n=1 Tax=Chlamydiifrater phoenicopteri TaxID=2681469 RepID=UPI001BCAD872|nr:aminoacyl-tRNA hydrolase [Chlamydiifrater phoenicopteri]